MNAVFLVGFMGAGKTTVGRLLAASLGTAFTDIDEEIVREQGRSVSEIFAAGGETGFRDAERAALGAAAARGGVIACGGGVVTDEGSRALLSDAGAVVYLRVSSDEAIARCGSEISGRPLLRACDPAAAAALLASRESLYSAAATITVETEGRTPAEVADAISEALRARR